MGVNPTEMTDKHVGWGFQSLPITVLNVLVAATGSAKFFASFVVYFCLYCLVAATEPRWDREQLVN